MFASLDMSRATLDAIDEYRHVALALLDEIEQRSSVNLSRHGKRTKREDAEGDLEGEYSGAEYRWTRELTPTRP